MLAGSVPVRGVRAGLRVLLDLPPSADAATVTATALRRGLAAAHLDEFRIDPTAGTGRTLVLGHGNLADRAVGAAVGMLAEVVMDQRRRSTGLSRPTGQA
ncbi:hypothetical protein [Streptomyces sp. RKAG293]|uniref:hypothetical protein n=1 Tax=Streptomyces sp. RKAG293 TaxID=2893403 RepID=UPI0020341F4F|nr:hypothetical protein [Streptomyces sp. RKAG293]MCM2417132.1 hypothetical protein [Streptomyces sp. RKAG293]